MCLILPVSPWGIFASPGWLASLSRRACHETTTSRRQCQEVVFALCQTSQFSKYRQTACASRRRFMGFVMAVPVVWSHTTYPTGVD
jgi:hypothetical protein